MYDYRVTETEFLPGSSDGKSDADPFICTVFVSYKKWLWFSHIFITFATSPWLITSGNATLLAAIALNAIYLGLNKGFMKT